MLEFLKSRYDAFSQRVLSSLSEIERRDVRAFDTWFYRSGGWRWLIGVVLLTTLVAWIASNFPWHMSFAEAAILFNVVVLTLLWSGLSAWFGYRRFQGRIFRYIVLAPAHFLDALQKEFGFNPPREHGLDVVDSLRAGTIMRERAQALGALTLAPMTEVTGIDVEDGRAPRPVVLGVREIREDLARRPRDHDLVLGVDSHGSPPRCAPSFSRPLAQPAPYMSTGPGPAKLSCSRTTSVLPPSSRNSTVTSDSRVSGTPDTQRHV